MKKSTLAICFATMTALGCSNFAPTPIEDKAPRAIPENWPSTSETSITGKYICTTCNRWKSQIVEPPVIQPKTAYDDSKKKFHYGDLVTLTNGFHEGGRGVVIGVSDKGYRVCLAITEVDPWIGRRISEHQSPELFDVPESSLQHYVPVPIPEINDEHSGS